MFRRGGLQNFVPSSFSSQETPNQNTDSKSNFVESTTISSSLTFDKDSCSFNALFDSDQSRQTDSASASASINAHYSNVNKQHTSPRRTESPSSNKHIFLANPSVNVHSTTRGTARGFGIRGRGRGRGDGRGGPNFSAGGFEAWK